MGMLGVFLISETLWNTTLPLAENHPQHSHLLHSEPTLCRLVRTPIGPLQPALQREMRLTAPLSSEDADGKHQ